MYEKIFEQTERLFKPISEIWALQTEAAEALARKQSSVITDVWNQGVVALQNIPGQKNIQDVFKLQQEYWENVNGSMRELMQDTQGVLLETNQKISAVLQKSTPNPVGNAVEQATIAMPAKAMAEIPKKVAPAIKKAVTPAAKPGASAVKGAPKAAAAVPAKAASSVAAAIQKKAPEAAQPLAAVVTPVDGKRENKVEVAKPPVAGANKES